MLFALKVAILITFTNYNYCFNKSYVNNIN